MAWVFGGKKFGQYTYEHWFDDEHEDIDKKDNDDENDKSEKEQMLKNDQTSEGND